MDINEFSDRFDVILNSYSGGEIYGDTRMIRSLEVNEYEKSLFLTQAQDQIVQNIYKGFETTEEVRQYLHNLITNYRFNQPVNSSDGISVDSKFYKIPEDVMFILNASIEDESKIISILPITHDEYYLQIRNPYRQYNETSAWRLDYKYIEENKVIEVITKANIDFFNIRYLKRPNPIILTSLGDLTIRGISEKTECELNQDLHDEILNMAVQLAIQSKSIGMPKENNKQTSNQ